MAAIVSTPSAPDAGKSAQEPAPPALSVLALPLAPRRILVGRAIKVTAEHFGTTPDVLISARLTRPLPRRRHVAMYVARELTGRSFSFIGRKLGDRHHTTIWHGVRVIKRLLAAGDAEITAAVKAITKQLRVKRRRA